MKDTLSYPKSHCMICSHKSSTQKKAIKHYQDLHPNAPEKCFDQFGETWDGNFDRIAKTLSLNITELNGVKNQYKESQAVNATLAAKLNAIIMILENKR